MLSERGGGAAASPAAGVLVLLCQDLSAKVPGLDLLEVGEGLRRRQPGVRVGLQPALCENPRAVGPALRAAAVRRLVLGLCSEDYPELEVQAQVRKAGLDPLGVGVAVLGRHSGAHINAGAQLLLSAAVARALAFRGSGAENLKTVLLPLQEKVSRRALFTMLPITYQPIPSVNRDLCAAPDGCEQCVAACPHAALSKAADGIFLHRDLCQGCGACVAICPWRALHFPGWSVEELEAQLDALLAPSAHTSPPGILFACKKSQPQPNEGWLTVRVPCMAMAFTSVVLHTLARGAGAVALADCGQNCPNGYGKKVQARVDYCQQLLTALGEEPPRVRFWAPGSPPPAGPSPTAVAPGPVALFGRGAAALAVEALAVQHPGAAGLVLESPLSPLGVVRITAGACTGCGACAEACPTAALRHRYEGDHVTLTFDPRMCTACGQCLSRCPERALGAIALVRVTDMGLLAGGPRSVFHDGVARCRRCGEPVAARRVLERLATILGEGNTAEALGRLCPDCRGLPL
ncbi:MAG: 4Fe-4S binding protein [Chloroflexi bacterium]|nr:4Fe-4S binding protein [Chloroflexota bacterium]